MSIKIRRALVQASLADHPRTTEALLALIPRSIRTKLNSSEIACLLVALRNQHEAGHSKGWQDHRDSGKA